MALNDAQKATLTQMAQDAEFRVAAQALFAAGDQAKALDERGVERKTVKEVTGSTAQYAHGEGGLFNQPGVENKSVFSLINAQGTTPNTPPVKPLINNGSGEEKEVEPEGDEPVEPDGDEAMPPKVAAKKKSVSDLTLEGLAEVIKAHTTNALSEALTQSPIVRELVGVIGVQSKAIADLRAEVAGLKDDEAQLKAAYDTPRFLMDMLASKSKSTEVADDDPLVVSTKATEREIEKEAAAFGGASSPFTMVGLGGSN